MRDEQTMFDLIVGVAKKDERVRAVVLNGSRVDPYAKKDRFQDYDVTYYVDDFETFPKDNQWIDVFGKRIYMQTRDDQVFIPDNSNDPDWYIYLMLFEDGNRIDLSIVDVSRMNQDAHHGDGFFKVLLDKDHRIKDTPRIHDETFYVKKPTQELYNAAVNECLWLVPSIGKGIEREEYTYALSMLDLTRDTLKAMCDWAIGVDHDFKINVGTFAKRYKTLLKAEWYDNYLKTYPSANREAIYQAVHVLMALFKEVGVYVANHLDYIYDVDGHNRIETYIRGLERREY